jgi:hypothetical protein
MQFKKSLMYSGIISAGALIASIFIPIIPCRIAPAVPNPIYKWTTCTLNPDSITNLNSIKEYFGYTSSLTEAYILTLLISFIVVMAFFHFATRRRRKF